MEDTFQKEGKKNLRKLPWYESVVSQFLIVTSICVVVVLATTIYVSYTKIVDALESAQMESQTTTLRSLTDDIDHVVYIYSKNLEMLGNSHTSRHVLSEVRLTGSSTSHTPSEVFAAYHDITTEKVWERIDLVDLQGVIQASTKADFSTTTPEYFEVQSLGDDYTDVGQMKVYDARHYENVGSVLVVVAPVFAPHVDSDTVLLGYTVGYLSSETIFRDLHSYAENISVTHDTSMYILNASGTVIYKDATSPLVTSATGTYDPAFYGTDAQNYVIKRGSDEGEYFITHAFFNGHGEYGGFNWLLVAQTNVNVIRDTMRDVSLKNVYYYIVAFLFTIILLFSYIFFFVLKPLNAINAHINESLLSGKINQLALKKKGEVGMLIYGYNLLVKLIQERATKLKKTTLETATLNKELEKTKEAILNILEDLDEEKQLVDNKVEERTAELISERQKLSHITENMRVGVILMNDNNVPVFINKQGKSMLDIKDDSSDALAQLKKKFPGEKVESLLYSCSIGESAQITEIQNNDGIFEITFKCEPLENKDDPNMFSGKGIWIRDITEAKQLERSKSELVAVASHQLRTPLTVTRGNLEMLLDELFGEVNKKQKELLSDSQESVIRLIGMVNDMLDITKIEKGDVELTIESFDVFEPLATVTKDMDDYATRHNFKINVTEPPKPVSVQADKSRLLQVFQNLVDNAIKYGREKDGEVTISIEKKGDMAEILIADNGIGIPPMEQGSIFQRFYRASNAVRFSSGGSGLGLFIVKSYIKQMGGTITFASKQDEGTTFTILLPLSTT